MFKTELIIGAAILAAALGGAVSAAQPAPPPTPEFVAAVAQSDHYEILAGRIAAVESQDQDVRSFALEMIQDHTRTSEALEQATMASHLAEPPIGISSDQRLMLGALQSLTGPDFDKAYVQQQVMAHQQALIVEQSYAEAGADGNLRRAAQSTVPLVQHHLEMAQRMHSAVGGS